MSEDIFVITRTQIIVVEPVSQAITIVESAPGSDGPQGPPGPEGPTGASGSGGSVNVTLVHPMMTAPAVATNNAASTFTAISDPNLRNAVDLRNMGKVRMLARLTTPATATKVRVQYHTGGNAMVATGDGGWTTLLTSAGSHISGTMFYTTETTVPSGAQINNCIIRVGIYDGDGAADPTLTQCVLNFYA